MPWYETENIHLCTIKDFIEICEILNIDIQESYINNDHKIRKINNSGSIWNNLFSKEGIFLLTKKK